MWGEGTSNLVPALGPAGVVRGRAGTNAHSETIVSATSTEARKIELLPSDNNNFLRDPILWGSRGQVSCQGWGRFLGLWAWRESGDWDLSPRSVHAVSFLCGNGDSSDPNQLGSQSEREACEKA